MSKLKITIEGDYISKLFIAQEIKAKLSSLPLSVTKDIRIFDEHIGNGVPDNFYGTAIIVKKQ